MKRFFVLLLVFNPYTIYSQDGAGEASKAFLDSIYREMDEVLDAMLRPKSLTTVSLGAGTGYYNFRSAASSQPQTAKKLLLSPAASYMHSSGFGISANAHAIGDSSKINVYQLAFTPSYDLIKRGKFTTGVAYTRFFTRKNLDFYTTPIQNELYASFNYKKPWLQPSVAVAYGWGSRTELEERRLQLLRLRRKRNPAIITVRSDEKVEDFTSLFSIRHEFSWTNLLGKKDLVSLTPIAMVAAGTRGFGFNTSFQSSNVSTNFLPNNQFVKEKTDFDLQSTTVIIRGECSFGMFFFQSQFLVDYYLQPAEKRLNNAFAIVGGITF